MRVLNTSGNIIAASFVAKPRNKPQVQLVIDLIKNKIQANEKIGLEDIIDIYTEWRIKCTRSKLTLQLFVYPTWRLVDHSSEGFKQQPSVKVLAQQWFKNNLAAAIINGKLLVIPVIDIE